MQLPTLAFPSDPLPVTFIPGTPTVEQENPLTPIRGGPVASIQTRDALNDHSTYRTSTSVWRQVPGGTEPDGAAQ
jgi:hypothetical protein